MEYTKNTEAAFLWIVQIFQRQNVPFQISGGLAAKIYGSKRPLNDIDVDIPDADFSKIIGDVKEFVVYGPVHYIDERWDCILMKLNCEGQEIDISGGTSMRICDARTDEWRNMPTDFSNSVQKEVFGITTPVIHPKDLVEYKSMLTGEHQKEDTDAVLTYLSRWGACAVQG